MHKRPKLTTIVRATAVAAAGISAFLGGVTPAYAWGDLGHEVVGLIANNYLDPAVRAKVNAILAGDATHLTSNTMIDSEATWADKFRDSSSAHRTQTAKWHFVDIEITAPNLTTACFGRPTLPAGTRASNGPASDCVVDKIEEFQAELLNSATTATELREALQFVLHFVGDIHQPLHSSDDHDAGGNDKTVTAPGIASNSLHHDWDTEFVNLLGSSESAIAQKLIANITDAQRTQWSAGTADDWAMESFTIAQNHAYGLLPAPTSTNHYSLPASYVTDAKAVVATQLSKAGVRLAFVLNNALK
jgi:nuclease S1